MSEKRRNVLIKVGFLIEVDGEKGWNLIGPVMEANGTSDVSLAVASFANLPTLPEGLNCIERTATLYGFCDAPVLLPSSSPTGKPRT